MKFILLLLLATMGRVVAAQTVSPVLLASCTGGGSFDNNQIFWSVGEDAVNTLSNLPFQLTQGFWQPELILLTGTNQPLQDEFAIACWPNPVSDGLQITFTGEKSIQLSLYSLDGRMLRHQTAVENGQILSMTELPAAMYLLQFATREGKWILTQKIVKQ